MTTTSDAIRTVTAKMQKAVDEGQRSASIDAHDLVEVLLAIADELEPAFRTTTACSAGNEEDGPYGRII